MKFLHCNAFVLGTALLISGQAKDEKKEAKPILPTVRVPRINGPIQVDGKLDEETWERAPKLALKAADGDDRAVRRTEVRLLHDGARLYVAFHCEDPDIWTAHQGRDSHMWTEDVVEVFIDIDDSEPGYVELEVSPLGDLFDAIFFEPRKKVLMAWNPEIQVEVSADGTVNRRGDTDRSWTVEMAIPAADLTPAPGVGRPGADIQPAIPWRMNFYRNEKSDEREKGELQAWAAVRGDFHATALFGHVVFE